MKILGFTRDYNLKKLGLTAHYNGCIILLRKAKASFMYNCIKDVFAFLWLYIRKKECEDYDE